jgi:hypothetical protein
MLAVYRFIVGSCFLCVRIFEAQRIPQGCVKVESKAVGWTRVLGFESANNLMHLCPGSCHYVNLKSVKVALVPTLARFSTDALACE